jgi:hypothetical protein
LRKKAVHPDPHRLFEQADELVNGYKNETDLRRAVSTAYYGVFHFLLQQVADTIAGAGIRSTELHSMVYRSVDHKPLKDLCNLFRSTTPSAKVRPFAPVGDFGTIVDFAGLVAQLQEQRIFADYDPTPPVPFDVVNSRIIVGYGREAVKHFSLATPEQRSAFVALLTIKPRQI